MAQEGLRASLSGRRKVEVSGLAAQGREKEQERKLLPGLVWGVGWGKDENASF